MLDSISPLFIGWCGPLFVIIPITLVLRRWLGRPILFAAIVYTLSIICGIVVDLSTDVSDRGSAIVAAFYAPLLICIIMMMGILFYRTILRKGLYKTAPDRLNTIEKGLLALGGLLSGALLGGLLGLFVGAFFSFFAATGAALELVLWTGLTPTDEQVDLMFNFGIYTFALIGVILGGVIGSKTAVNDEISSNSA